MGDLRIVAVYEDPLWFRGLQDFLAEADMGDVVGAGSLSEVGVLADLVPYDVFIVDPKCVQLLFGKSELPDTYFALAPHDMDLWRMLADGVEQALIADKLCVSPRTVKDRVCRLYDKLGVVNRAQAIYLAGRIGILER